MFAIHNIQLLIKYLSLCTQYIIHSQFQFEVTHGYLSCILQTYVVHCVLFKILICCSVPHFSWGLPLVFYDLYTVLYEKLIPAYHIALLQNIYWNTCKFEYYSILKCIKLFIHLFKCILSIQCECVLCIRCIMCYIAQCNFCAQYMNLFPNCTHCI